MGSVHENFPECSSQILGALLSLESEESGCPSVEVTHALHVISDCSAALSESLATRLRNALQKGPLLQLAHVQKEIRAYRAFFSKSHWWWWPEKIP